MYVYIFIFTYATIYIHICTLIYIYIHICILTHEHIKFCIHVYICIFIHGISVYYSISFGKHHNSYGFNSGDLRERERERVCVCERERCMYI